MPNNNLLSLARRHDGPDTSRISPADIEAAVYRAVDGVNELLADTQQLEKRRDSLLLETGTVLDSMAVVNLLVFVEDEVKAAFGREISLADEDDPGSLDPASLKTLGTLIDALQTLLSHSK
jgi:acyl carrier protein